MFAHCLLFVLILEDDVDAGRECIIKGHHTYLSEDPKDLVQDYMDMTGASTLSAIERTMVGIHVAKETPSSNSSDVGVILEGVVVLRDLENVALATAVLFGFFYILNMKYPSKLHYTMEAIQKMMMELDAADLRKAQSLKTKVHQ
ncbi:hypothetical protein MHYP_G00285160 [Metynnis hypsauchen]